MPRRHTLDPLDILTPLDEQPEEIKPIDSTNTVPHTPAEVGSSHGPSTHPQTLLEEAANLILSQLSPTVRDFFIEVADVVLRIPRWELMAGSVMAQYSQGTLVSPDLDPSWREPSLLTTERECPQCHHLFSPQRIGQKYCSNLCGNLARRHEVEQRIKQIEESERLKILSRLDKEIDEVKRGTYPPQKIIVSHDVYTLIQPVLGKRDTYRGIPIAVEIDVPDRHISLIS